MLNNGPVKLPEETKVASIHNREFYAVLKELFKGNDTPFMAYIVDNQITKLSLNIIGPNRETTYLFDHEIEAIIKAAAQTGITSIDLENNRMNGEFIAKMINLLSGSQVKELGLCCTLAARKRVKDRNRDLMDMAKALANSAIDSVDLSNNDLSTYDIGMLFKCLEGKSFKQVKLDNNTYKLADLALLIIKKVDAQEYVPALNAMKVTELSLRRNALDNDAVPVIANWAKQSFVEKIDLRDNRIDENGLKELFNAIPQTNITWLGVDKEFKNNPTLQRNTLNNALVRYYATFLHSRLYKNGQPAYLSQATPFTKEPLTAREKELEAAGNILIRVPADVRSIIESYVAGSESKANRYHAIRNSTHPVQQSVALPTARKPTILERTVSNVKDLANTVHGTISRRTRK